MKTPEQIQFARQFALVAGMSGDSKTVEHVRQVLESAGIGCTYEGSALYDLYVERTKVGRARELLRSEQAKGWRIVFSEESGGA